jgi:hypothetical protein
MRPLSSLAAFLGTYETGFLDNKTLTKLREPACNI